MEDHSDCRITDLHAWAVAPGHLAVILAVQSPAVLTPADIKQMLSGIPNLLHVNVEVHGA